jgi:hypothetical protein
MLQSKRKERFKMSGVEVFGICFVAGWILLLIVPLILEVFFDY